VSAGPDSTVLKPEQLVFCNPTIHVRDGAAGGTSILQGWFGGMTAEPRKLMQGTWRNGAWAERMLVPTENLVPLDEGRLFGELGYSVPQLCWINEYLVPYGGWLAAGLMPGQTAIVAPATGHFGGCAVKVALAMGARRVVAAGRKAASLKTVEGLDRKGRVKGVVRSGDADADAQAFRQASPAGKGGDIYVDFSPPQAENATHPQACIADLRHGGQAVLMGGVRSNLSLNYAQLMINNITVRGNFMYEPDAPAKLLGLLEGGLLSLEGLSTTVSGFEDLEDGIQFSAKHVGMADLTVLTPVGE